MDYEKELVDKIWLIWRFGYKNIMSPLKLMMIELFIRSFVKIDYFIC